MKSPPIKSDTVTMRDCLRAGHCVRGVKAFLSERGIDVRGFARGGMALTDAEAMRDGYVDQIIARKRAREQSGGR